MAEQALLDEPGGEEATVAPARGGYSFDVRVDPLPSLPELRLLGRVRTTRAGQHYLPLHRHHELELAYLCRGSVRWFAHGRTNFLAAGQAFLTMPTTPHGGGQDTLQPSELLWVQLALPEGGDAEFLRCTASETGALMAGLTPLDGTVVGPSPEIGRILAELLEAVDGGDTPDVTLKVRSGLLYLLQHVLDSARRPRTISEPIARAVRMMEEDLGTRITVASIAQRAGLSPSHFQHLFRAEMGIGPADFHLNLRLSEACRILAETDDSILTVALNLGFSSSQHFATSFKQLFGISPRDYRSSAHQPTVPMSPDDIPWVR